VAKTRDRADTALARKSRSTTRQAVPVVGGPRLELRFWATTCTRYETVCATGQNIPLAAEQFLGRGASQSWPVRRQIKPGCLNRGLLVVGGRRDLIVLRTRVRARLPQSAQAVQASDRR
jgi:hypothetical protein